MDRYDENGGRSSKKVNLLTRLTQFLGTHSCSGFYGFMGCTAICSYLVGHYASIPLFMRVGEGIFFIGILIYLAHFNHRKVFAFLHVNTNISHLPVQQIRLMNVLFLAFFLFLLVLGAAILLTLPYREVIASLGAFLLAVIRYIVALFYHPGPQEQVTELPPEEGFNFASLFPENTKEPNEILMFLADFLTWAIAIAFFVFLAYQLVCLLYHKIIELRSRRQKLYLDEFTTPLMRREKLPKPKSKDKKLKWTDFSETGRVRRLYKKLIKNGLAKQQKDPALRSSLHSLTPAELERQAGLSGTEQMNLLHEQYEKARYSQTDRAGKDKTT